MLITCPNILDAADLARLEPLIAALNWDEGERTAGAVAAQVKRNWQADLTAGVGAKTDTILRDKLVRHPVIQNAALPLRWSKRMLSKTEVGGGYGLHTDNPFMRCEAGQPMRTDLSFTLFLTAPDTYAGGELIIEHAGMTHSLKPAAM